MVPREPELAPRLPTQQESLPVKQAWQQRPRSGQPTAHRKQRSLASPLPHPV